MTMEFLPEKRHARLTVGEMLRMTREFAELTQAELQKRSGVPQTAISAIEHDRLPLGAERARRLGDALGIHPGALLFPDWTPRSRPLARATARAVKKGVQKRAATK
jgi:transcriptional regulator with XRE-family HTH domain